MTTETKKAQAGSLSKGAERRCAADKPCAQAADAQENYTQAEMERFMRAALREAKKAGDAGEVPVGAVVVCEGKIVARGKNERETKKDPTAHAEAVALRKAGKKLDRWNLSDCDLFVTLEPCVMCSGAIVYARVRTVYYGADDLRFGCCGTLMNLAQDERLNHRARVVGGVLRDECLAPIREFFREKRAAGKRKFST